MNEPKGKKRFKPKRVAVESDDFTLPHGMPYSEWAKATRSRAGNTGYVQPTQQRNPAGDAVGKPHMVAVDPTSKTQRRKENKKAGNYGCQANHKMRKDGKRADGNRRRILKESKRQVLRTAGVAFDKVKGYILEQGRSGVKGSM